MALTHQKEKFILHYFENGKSSEAYKHAYKTGKMKPATISNNAYMLLQDSDVTARLNELREMATSKAVMTKQEALERLTLNARVTVNDVAEFSARVVGQDDDGADIVETIWRMKNSDEINPTALAAIKSVTATRTGPKFEMHDSQGAIKQLSDMLGWNAPKQTELSGIDGAPIQTQWTVEFVNATHKDEE